MYNMTIELQLNKDKCLYEQIYEHIRREIREGKLLAGERLPSTRSLAEYLQVARSTVDAAYDQLVGEGYIEAKPYKGYFVCTIEEFLTSDKFYTNAFAVSKELAISSNVDSQEYLYDFSPHAIDIAQFPYSVWKKISREILHEGNQELFLQGEPQGDYSLRLTISRYLHTQRGVSCTPEQIIVGAGNDYLLMLLEKILGHSIEIAMEDPTYRRAYRIFQSFGYKVKLVGADDNGMLVTDLEKQNAQVAYVMPSHQFPAGTVMPIGRRTEILNWAAKQKNRYLIEDDYDSEFRYHGKPIPALQSIDTQGKVIYMGTFSKAVAPAIRIGYMVLPKELLEVYTKTLSFYSCTVSRVDQKILNEFISKGYFERHLNKMRKLYRMKHETLIECLRPFEGRFQVSGENAGLHLVLTARNEKSEDTLIQEAASKKVKVYGMNNSKVTKTTRDAAVLLGFGGLTCQEIIEGTQLLQEAWLR